MADTEDTFDLDALDYPERPTETGTAPRPELSERLVRTQVWHDVSCGRYQSALTPVMSDTVLEDGAWTSLQAHDALRVTLDGGYGMYVDPMTDWNGRGLTNNVLLLCAPCANWLRSEIPGVDLVLQRLAHS